MTHGTSTNQQKKAARSAKAKQKSAANRTMARLAKHDTQQYKKMSVRQLAEHMKQIGIGCLKNRTHTNSNKILFTNDSTGWYVCYDRIGEYNTVHNQFGNYVALDGSVSKSGKDAKYHFRNR